MFNIEHVSLTELEAGLGNICQSPKNEGTLKMIVRRPDEDEREVVESAELDLQEGLIGDNWKARGSKHSPDGSANTEAQITVMNARTISLIAQSEECWSLAGDQLYIDMDLGDENVPPGTRLAIGSAVIEISSKPHTGCGKFTARFGSDATKFVNSPAGRQLHLRGVNTKIVQAGTVRVGDVIRKV